MRDHPGIIGQMPFGQVVKPGRYGVETGAPGLSVSERRNFSLIEIKAFPGKELELQHLFARLHGMSLPVQARREVGPSFTVVWAGPGQWVVEGPDQLDFFEELHNGLKHLAAVIDQSDGRCFLRLHGPKLRDILRKGTSIDLHPRAFAVNGVALTLMAGIDVHLWLSEDSSSDVCFARSMTGSFWNWLRDAGAEFGIDVVAA